MNKDTSVIVMGAGLFGSSVAKKLFELGIEVMVVDHNYDIIEELANNVTTAVQCDLFDEKAVDELGIANFDVAIIGIGSNLESSIIATLAAKDRNVNRIIAKATTHTQARILEKLGADQVIFPEIDMGERLARSISGKNFLEYIHFSDEYTIMEIEALDDWIGKSLVDMDFYNKYHMNVVAFRRDKTTTLSNLAQYKIQSGDYLILIGKYSDAEQLEVLD
ncbi:MAG: TrkA family potassium uptake protein [Clostridiaceae bacterium]|jgi:trk system potassium uptake protein TrkA|nr:TrkA family potassium uptake protein [Clostridiaceae bacterium]